MISSPQAFLDSQSKKYRTHLTIISRLTTTIRLQRNIQKYKTIPKQYMPPSFPSTPADKESTLRKSFQQKYNDIFDHLTEVITFNTISLELEESRLKNIISHTQKHLASLSLSTTDISHLHHQFLTDNNIVNHHIHPDLQRTLATLPAHTQPNQKPNTSCAEHDRLTKGTKKRTHPSTTKPLARKKAKTTSPLPTTQSTRQHIESSDTASASPRHFLSQRAPNQHLR